MTVPAVEALAEIGARLGTLVDRLTDPAVLTASAVPPVAGRLPVDPLDLLAGVLPPPQDEDGGREDDPDEQAYDHAYDRPPHPGWDDAAVATGVAGRSAWTAHRGAPDRGPVEARPVADRQPPPAPVAPTITRRVTVLPVDPPSAGGHAAGAPQPHGAVRDRSRPGPPLPDEAAVDVPVVPDVPDATPSGSRGVHRPEPGTDARRGAPRPARTVPAGELVDVDRLAHDPDRPPDRGPALRVRHDPGRAAAVLRANLADPPAPGQTPRAPDETAGGGRAEPAPVAPHIPVDPHIPGPPPADVVAELLGPASLDDLYAALADRLHLDVLRAYGTTEG